MKNWTVQSILACALVVNMSSLTAATSVIGVAISSGPVTVDNSLVPGNATLFDGNTVSTGAASSRLQLKSGKMAIVGTESSVKVFGDHLDLMKGVSETSGNYAVEANTLRITGNSARVSLKGKTVEVAALGSAVMVSTAAGVEVANLLPGNALAFTPQDSGALAPATLSGCVRKVGTEFLMTDQTSGVTVQLIGGGIEQQVKKAVKITGTPATGTTPAAGASQVLNVSNLTALGSCKTVFGAGAAAGGAAAAGAAGLSTAAIIAGVVVVAAIGATAGVLATQVGGGTTALTLSGTAQ